MAVTAPSCRMMNRTVDNGPGSGYRRLRCIHASRSLGSQGQGRSDDGGGGAGRRRSHLHRRVDAGDDLSLLTDSGTEAVIDFTHPDVVMDNPKVLIDNGIHAVVGTTGFDEERLAIRCGSWLTTNRGAAVLIAPNFDRSWCSACISPRLHPYFDSVEIIELCTTRTRPTPRRAPRTRTAKRWQARAAKGPAAPTPMPPARSSRARVGLTSTASGRTRYG